MTIGDPFRGSLVGIGFLDTVSVPVHVGTFMSSRDLICRATDDVVCEAHAPGAAK